MTDTSPSKFRRFVTASFWGYGLFWSWNLIFLAFMAFGFAPQLLPNLINSVRTTQAPPEFLLYALLMTLIPLAAVVLGLTTLRREPRKLLVLGYGVEGPLLLLLLARFFVVRQATAAISLTLALAGLGLLTLLWQLLDRKINERGPWASALRLAGLTLMLILGVYAAVWLAFYVVPLTTLVVENLLRFLGELSQHLRELYEALTSPTFWRDLLLNWQLLPLMVFGGLLAAYSGTLLVALPIAVTVIYARAWLAGLATARARLGRPLAALVPVAVLLLGGGLLLLLNRQPQGKAFALLAQPPASPIEAQALLNRQDEIRAGLLNAYLAPQRYISAVGEVRHVRDLYAEAFNIPSDQAGRVQALYESVAQPLLYQPVEPIQPNAGWDNQALQREPAQAAELYESFFDRPLVEAERPAVVAAVRATWNVDAAMSAWQAVDDREVHLLRQEVTVTPQGDWAEIELIEVYQNVTALRQEVVYYFSLPESAVVTGLWLGPSADREHRFAYRISPRGAAQAVYRNEVRRQIDPALVEQIGPRQYRLRIFPIDPQQIEYEPNSLRGTIQEGEPLYMWLTYRTLAVEGAWPLPQMSEKLNVFWDDATVRLLNGQPLALGAAADEIWLPASAPAAAAGAPATHRVDFPGNRTVIARPLSAAVQPGLPDKVRLAVVLDRSRSMADQQAALEASFERLQTLLSTGAQVDVYLTASPFRGEAPSLVRLEDFDAHSILTFGGQNAAELLAQYTDLRRDRTYDAVLVLTDGSGYALGEGDVTVAPSPAPIWLVHLGGFPLGYDDPTLDAVQASGGGAAASVDEALTRLAIGLNGQAEGVITDIVDGYEWLTLSTEMANALSSVGPEALADARQFAPFAARRLILAEMQAGRSRITDLALLDRLHAVAVNDSIVTPLSSMIVLVNAPQELLLDKLEAQDDRFQREHEDVGETVAAPPVAAVPEPEEWLLISLMAGLLVWYGRSKRRETRLDAAVQ